MHLFFLLMCYSHLFLSNLNHLHVDHQHHLHTFQHAKYTRWVLVIPTPPEEKWIILLHPIMMIIIKMSGWNDWVDDPALNSFSWDVFPLSFVPFAPNIKLCALFISSYYIMNLWSVKSNLFVLSSPLDDSVMKSKQWSSSSSWISLSSSTFQLQHHNYHFHVHHYLTQDIILSDVDDDDDENEGKGEGSEKIVWWLWNLLAGGWDLMDAGVEMTQDEK